MAAVAAVTVAAVLVVVVVGSSNTRRERKGLPRVAYRWQQEPLNKEEKREL
jgi:hypothetical protein